MLGGHHRLKFNGVSTGYRNVVMLKGKNTNIKGSGKINKRLLKSVLLLYISMPPKVQNKNTKNKNSNTSTKKDDDDKKAKAVNKIIGAFSQKD